MNDTFSKIVQEMSFLKRNVGLNEKYGKIGGGEQEFQLKVVEAHRKCRYKHLQHYPLIMLYVNQWYKY